MSSRLMFFTLFALLAGCERRGTNSMEDRVHASQALQNVLAYPQSSLVSVSSGNEAAEMMLSSPAPVRAIVAWYLEVLPLNKWKIKTSTQDRAGNVSIYAERNTRPLWITIQPNAGGSGTTYRLVGVFTIDTTKADSAKVKKGSAR